MGQTLERFSSVSEEKKNKEIDRIVGEVYEKYLGKSEIEKISRELETEKASKKTEGTSETSKKTEGNQTSKKTEGNSETEGNQTSKKTEGNSETSKKTEGNQTSKKTEGNPETSKKTEGNLEPSQAKTSKLKANFYMAVCEIVGELNKTFGNTQFKVPDIKNLNKTFEEHHRTTEPVTKREFQSMLQYILKTESLFPGFGAKDALVYIFTVPAAAVLAKQRFFPRAIPNDVLIPGVTSATVFALAKLNKI